MKKQLLYFVLFFSAISFAQVGVNTTSPDPSSMLDISATDKGVLVPRVSLTNVTTTMLDGTNTAAIGLLIWNTNATTVGGNGVGFYFFNGTQWMPITQTASVNTLDQAYDQGGAGAGKNIYATDGAVRINGDDGFLVTGTYGSGNTIDTEITGAGTKMFFNPRKAAFRAGYTLGNQWDDINIGSYSTAFGRNTNASGIYSIASGYSSTASGTYSTAFGNNTLASGQYSTAFGSGSTASGVHSIAFGQNTLASYQNAIAFGAYNQAIGDFSTAFGAYTQASGSVSTAFGLYTVASGDSSTALGGYTDAIGQFSTAFGLNSEAHGYSSTALGSGNFARSYGENVLGIGATDYTPSLNGDTQFRTANQNDRLFVIGNAIDSNSNTIIDALERSNALTIYKNGRMNINDAYNMPLTDGTANQVMTTDGVGNVSWVTPSTGTDDQNLTTPTLVGTTLNLGIENGTGTSIDLALLQDGKNTLDQAYNQGGAGAGRSIIANNGSVIIDGTDGFLVRGSLNSGSAILAAGVGARMFFNPRKAAFRAGHAYTSEWDDINVGQGSVGLGFGVKASGINSIAFGEIVQANGDYSSVLGGRSSRANGNTSTAFGQNNLANGFVSTAWGSQNEASGYYSTVWGNQNFARSYGETVIGVGATDYTPSTSGATQNGTSNQNDRLFVIGNGVDINGDGAYYTAERSNALTIYKNGRMNINDAYNMPLTDGLVNQVLKTDGAGNTSWVDSSTIFTDTNTDNQTIDSIILTGTTLSISLENDGVAPQTVDLSSLTNDWKLTGNSGTNSLVNFIGTTDNQDLVFKRNNGYSGAIGSSNTSLGLNTLNQATTGDSNAAFGMFTLTSNTDGEGNSALGYNVLRNNTTGSFNVAIGRSALFANTIGVENTALGNNSNSLNTTSSGNIAVGFDALYTQSFNNAGAAWYSYNTAIGYSSLRSNQPTAVTNAVQNTAVGAFTLNNNLRGKNNTALGFEALRNNRNSSQNVAVGSRALFTQSHPNGGTEWESNNVAIGFESLFSNQPTNATNAINNSAVGTHSLYSNTTGIGNTAIGYRALYTNTTSPNNVAIGIEALALSTATSNVAVGAYSLATNAAGTENTAVGRAALDTNTSGNYNTAIGRDALDANSTGDGLTGLGRGTDVSVDGLSNSTAIGYNAVVNASNKIRIGNAGITVIEGQVAYSFPSDARFKFNLQDNVPGLLFIKKLKPITYQFDTEKFDSYVGKNNPENNTESFQKSKEIIHSGFLAQDIEKVCQELKYDFDGLHIPDTKNQTDHYSVAYSQFIMPMVKAIQEQQEIIEQQNNELEQLKSEIKQLKTLEERIKLLENK